MFDGLTTTALATPVKRLVGLFWRRDPLVLVSSLAGLLTVAALQGGDSSPLSTLENALAWFGVDIHHAVAEVNQWMAAPGRHHGLVLAASALLIGAVVHQCYQMVRHQETRDAVRDSIDEKGNIPYFLDVETTTKLAYDRRFWALFWLSCALLAQLGEATVARAEFLAIAVVASRIVADTIDSVRFYLAEERRRGYAIRWPSWPYYPPSVVGSVAYTLGMGFLSLTAAVIFAASVVVTPRFDYKPEPPPEEGRKLRKLHAEVEQAHRESLRPIRTRKVE